MRASESPTEGRVQELQRLILARDRQRAKKAAALKRALLPAVPAPCAALLPPVPAPRVTTTSLAPLRSPPRHRTRLSRREATALGLSRRLAGMVHVRFETAGSTTIVHTACGIVLAGGRRCILTTSAAVDPHAVITVQRVRAATHSPQEAAHSATLIVVDRECGCALLTTASEAFWRSRSDADALSLGGGWASSEPRDHALLAAGTSLFLAGTWRRHAEEEAEGGGGRAARSGSVAFARVVTSGPPALTHRLGASTPTLAYSIAAGAASIATTATAAGGGGAFDSHGRLCGMVVPAREDLGAAPAPPLIVPCAVLRAFVESAQHARAAALPYTTRRSLDAGLQPMRNSALRQRHGIGASHAERGVLVTRARRETSPSSPAVDALRVGDILLAIARWPVHQNGTIALPLLQLKLAGDRAAAGGDGAAAPREVAIPVENFVAMHAMSDTLELEVFRDGTRRFLFLAEEVPPTSSPSSSSAAAASAAMTPFSTARSWFVVGGLVFTEQRDGRGSSSVVLLQDVLDADVNSGYERSELRGRVVESFCDDSDAGRSGLRQFRLAVNSALWGAPGKRKAFLEFGLRLAHGVANTAVTVVLDSAMCIATDADVLRQYGVPSECSLDLLEPEVVVTKASSAALVLPETQMMTPKTAATALAAEPAVGDGAVVRLPSAPEQLSPLEQLNALRVCISAHTPTELIRIVLSAADHRDAEALVSALGASPPLAAVAHALDSVCETLEATSRELTSGGSAAVSPTPTDLAAALTALCPSGTGAATQMLGAVFDMHTTGGHGRMSKAALHRYFAIICAVNLRERALARCLAGRDDDDAARAREQRATIAKSATALGASLTGQCLDAADARLLGWVRRSQFIRWAFRNSAAERSKPQLEQIATMSSGNEAEDGDAMASAAAEEEMISDRAINSALAHVEAQMGRLGVEHLAAVLRGVATPTLSRKQFCDSVLIAAQLSESPAQTHALHRLYDVFNRSGKQVTSRCVLAGMTAFYSKSLDEASTLVWSTISDEEGLASESALIEFLHPMLLVAHFRRHRAQLPQCSSNEYALPMARAMAKDCMSFKPPGGGGGGGAGAAAAGTDNGRVNAAKFCEWFIARSSLRVIETPAEEVFIPDEDNFVAAASLAKTIKRAKAVAKKAASVSLRRAKEAFRMVQKAKAIRAASVAVDVALEAAVDATLAAAAAEMRCVSASKAEEMKKKLRRAVRSALKTARAAAKRAAAVAANSQKRIQKAKEKIAAKKAGVSRSEKYRQLMLHRNAVAEAAVEAARGAAAAARLAGAVLTSRDPARTQLNMRTFADGSSVTQFVDGSLLQVSAEGECVHVGADGVVKIYDTREDVPSVFMAEPLSVSAALSVSQRIPPPEIVAPELEVGGEFVVHHVAEEVGEEEGAGEEPSAVKTMTRENIRDAHRSAMPFMRHELPSIGVKKEEVKKTIKEVKNTTMTRENIRDAHRSAMPFLRHELPSIGVKMKEEAKKKTTSLRSSGRGQRIVMPFRKEEDAEEVVAEAPASAFEGVAILSQQTFPDGSKVLILADNSVVQKGADGKGMRAYADGTVAELG